jgi:hypothetical protein
MQGQDAKGDQRRGRDFRHQNAQPLEFSGHFGRAMLATDTEGTLLVPGAKGPACCLQELAQTSIVSRVKGIVALLTIAGSLTIAACSLFGPREAERHDESGRALYRAAEENPADAPDVAPLREKVPGETR